MAFSTRWYYPSPENFKKHSVTFLVLWAWLRFSSFAARPALGFSFVSSLLPSHTFLVGGVPIGPDSTSLKVSTPLAVGFGEECSKCEFLGLHLRFCCITPLCSRILLLLSTLKILRKGVQRSTAKYGARGSFQCSLW